MKSFVNFFDRQLSLKLTKVCFLLLLCFNFQNCYFNPFVYSLLNPELEEGEEGLFFGGLLAALNSGPNRFSVSGIIRNGSGIAQTSKSFLVTNKESTESGLDVEGITDAGGRFFLLVGKGATTIEVEDDSLPLVKFTLNVIDAKNIQVSNVEPASFEIGNLVSYDPNNKPVFFDLISSTPLNNSTGYNFGSFGYNFTFSQDIEQPQIGDEINWLNSNVIVSPSITFGSPSFGTNSIMGMIENGVPTAPTNFTIKLMPSIKSIGGISLSATEIKFQSADLQ